MIKIGKLAEGENRCFCLFFKCSRDGVCAAVDPVVAGSSPVALACPNLRRIPDSRSGGLLLPFHGIAEFTKHQPSL